MQRRFRLRRAADFERLRSDGKVWHHALAVMIVYPNGGKTSRFGFSASKRVGRAVERNRAKRLLRQSVYRHMSEVRSGWDFLFIARKATSEASFYQVDLALTQLLLRAELLNVEQKPDSSAI